MSSNDQGHHASRVGNLIPPGTSPDRPVTLVGSDAAGNVIQQRGFPNLAALNQWLASYEGQTALEYNRVWRVVSE